MFGRGGHGWGGEKTYSTPGVTGAIATILLDLEPDGVGAGHVGGAVVVGALGHVGDGGADVGGGPLGPVQVDGGAGGDGGGQVGRGGALDAVGSIAAALDVSVGQVRDGAVALDRAGHALRGGARVRVCVRLVEGVVGVAEGGVGHEAVAGDHGRRGEETGEGRDLAECVHFGFWERYGYWLTRGFVADRSGETNGRGGREENGSVLFVFGNERQPQADRFE